MTKFRIAQVAPLWKEVPPPQYGGVELVVSLLTEELVKAGHDVTLFACGGSRTSGNLVTILDKSLYDLKGRFNWQSIEAEEFLLLHELCQRADQFDIIHFHGGIHFLAVAPLLKAKVLTTYHSSVEPDFKLLADAFAKYNFVSISNAQRKLAPQFNFVETIYHGIDTKLFQTNLNKDQEYFCYLSTLSQAKGIDIAVKAAHDLGIKLKIAGDIRDSEEEFLKENVWPFVDGKQIEYIGEVGHTAKNELLKGAKAMLFPTQWNEAFGLVMVESLASGTPVIAYNNGSVPEVIEHGKTGFVIDNYHDFLQNIRSIDQIDRQICRQEAEKRFDAKIMAEHYLDLYQRL